MSTDVARLPPVLRFGPGGRFELQTAERRLLVDGRPAALGGRALDLLMALAARPDHLMTKDELLERVWPGLVVEEGNVQVQISHLRKALGGDLIATVPGRGYRFVAAVAGAPPPVPSPSPATVGPSAAAAPRLFGRADDLARLEAALERTACLTLVGPSGVGKTSLARAAAARWPGRTAWVDLAVLAEGSHVEPALARSLSLQLGGGDMLAQLVAALQGQNGWLMVLDNAEHLIGTCARVASALAALPGLRLLVTSQLPLAVAGERVQRLEPLRLGGDGALALLIDRITAADQRFRVTDEGAPLLESICTRLDGLPLALEMAAARVATIGLGAVHDALAERFALLRRGQRDAGQRHRTLHDAIDWSYRLLEPEEQRLFRRLGVFAGEFGLDAAVALAAETPDERYDVIDRLAALIDRSLVAASADEPPQYRLLETLRAYALDRLAEAGEADAVRRRQAEELLGLFARYGLEPTVRARCHAELANARDALAWARRHDLALAAMLAGRAIGVAVYTVWRSEAGDWLQGLRPTMESDAGLALAAEVQATYWGGMARMLTMRGMADAPEVAQRALALWRPLNARETMHAAVAWVRAVRQAGAELDQACDALRAAVAAIPPAEAFASMHYMAHSALVSADLMRGDYVAVLDGRLREVAMAVELGMVEAAEGGMSNVVHALVRLGREAEACQQGQALLARIDARNGDANGNLPWVFRGLLDALLGLGRIDELLALAPRAWAAGLRFNVLVVIAGPLIELAVQQERFEAAAMLLGHLEQWQARRGQTPASELREVRQRVGERHGEAATVEAVLRGRGLSDEQALAVALGAATLPETVKK